MKKSVKSNKQLQADRTEKHLQISSSNKSKVGKENRMANRSSISLTRVLFQAGMLLISFLTLLIYFSIGPNRAWISERILTYCQDFNEQKDSLSIEFRKDYRYGSSYTISKMIESELRKRARAEDVLLLLPPTDYITANGEEYKVPEPAVFYYYTGIKSIWADSKDASKANWYFDVINHQPQLIMVTDNGEIQRAILKFNKYKASL